MSQLTDPGRITYGGFTFPVETQTTGIIVRPVLDSAGRTVIYNEITVSLRARLSGPLMDTQTRLIERQLTKTAFPFIYSGRGFGLAVNVSEARDVLWGPIPGPVEIKPLGGGQAVELKWSVTIHIPDGPGARYRFAPLEFSFGLTFDVDDAGYTTRTYAGFLRVPMTRNAPNVRTLPDSVDEYREDVYPPLLPGFRRTPGSWVIAASKSRVDFTVTDEQMAPNFPPPGVIRATASGRITSTPGKLLEWTGVVEGDYEIARNGTASVAAARNAFFALVKDRVNHTIDTISRLATTELRADGTGPGTKPCVAPVSFMMAEPDIYGRTRVQYSLTYKVTGANLRSMLQASGLWRPVPGSNWKLWSASLGTVLSARGHAGLIFSPNDDRIVDLLQPGPMQHDLSNRRGQVGTDFRTIPQDVFPEPSPDSSWLSYTNHVYVETDSGVVEVRTLPTEPRTAAGDLGGAGLSAGAAAGIAAGAIDGLWTAGGAASPFYFPPPRTPSQQRKGGLDKKQAPQRRARQGGALVMVGSAVRVKFAIPQPTATRWGDATLTPANRPDRGEGFFTGVVGNAIWPVTAARWRLRFLMDTVPSDGVAVVPNPLQGGGGSAGPPDLGNVIDPALPRVPPPD